MHLKYIAIGAEHRKIIQKREYEITFGELSAGWRIGSEVIFKKHVKYNG